MREREEGKFLQLQAIAHRKMDRNEILWSNRFSPFSYKDDLEAP